MAVKQAISLFSILFYFSPIKLVKRCRISAGAGCLMHKMANEMKVLCTSSYICDAIHIHILFRDYYQPIRVLYLGEYFFFRSAQVAEINNCFVNWW